MEEYFYILLGFVLCSFYISLSSLFYYVRTKSNSLKANKFSLLLLLSSVLVSCQAIVLFVDEVISHFKEQDSIFFLISLPVQKAFLFTARCVLQIKIWYQLNMILKRRANNVYKILLVTKIAFIVALISSILLIFLPSFSQFVEKIDGASKYLSDLLILKIFTPLLYFLNSLSRLVVTVLVIIEVCKHKECNLRNSFECGKLQKLLRRLAIFIVAIFINDFAFLVAAMTLNKVSTNMYRNFLPTVAFLNSFLNIIFVNLIFADCKKRLLFLQCKCLCKKRLSRPQVIIFLISLKRRK